MQVVTTLTLMVSVLLQGTTLQLADILTAVSRNVKESRDALPDFLCNEKVTSTRFNAAKTREQRVVAVESIYSIRQGNEHRDILAIDGKPAKKGAKMPHMPLNIIGSFNISIGETFAPKVLPLYSYVLAQQADESRRLVIQFETKKDQQGLRWNIFGDIRAADDTGQAWIDPKSMQVVRFERNLHNVGSGFSSWKNTIEQMPVDVKEKQFWVAKTFVTEIVEKDSRSGFTFLAEYSNCKKFTTEITIRPQ
jgi:hypothetical protein